MEVILKELILVVDDETSIRNLIEVYLKNEGFEVIKAKNGLEALKLLEQYKFDMVILDIMMPKLDGINLCIKIRKKYHMPVLFLTAKDREIDKIEGLTIGADDYLTKPFNSMEFLARVKAHLRRYTTYNSLQEKNILSIDDLIIDRSSHEVRMCNKLINLTPKEYAILECLAMNKGNVLTIEKLYELVWKEPFIVSDTSITVHITNLRHKLETDPKNPQYIKTIWGVGYKI